jgi:hypothetical protein
LLELPNRLPRKLFWELIVMRNCRPCLALAALAALAVLAPSLAHAQATVPAAATQTPAAAQTPADANWGTLELFNGRDFEGLHVFVEDPQMEASEVVRVEDGMIRVTGAGKGYVRTTNALADYKLSFEWRWPAAGGNSGLLLHVVNPDAIWPKGFEVQLAAGRAGDLSSYADARSKEEKVSRNPTGFSTGRLPRTAPADVEKAEGEWNTMEVLAVGDALTVFINGVEVNRMTGVMPSGGTIGLQAEGRRSTFAMCG